MTTVLSRMNDLARKLVGGARDAIGQLRAADTALRQEHARSLEERSKLLNAKPPREEILAELNRQVEQIAAQYAADHGERIVTAVASRVECEPGRDVVTGIRTGSLTAAFGALTGIDLCALAPDMVKASLTKIVQSVEYAPGPPMADRVRLIAEVDEHIAAVERQHAALCDSAAEAGVSLEHMEGERARRIQEAQRADRARRFNAANRDAINRGVVKALEE